MKSLLSTPKRAILSVVCVVVVIAAVCVMAVRGTLISKAQAQAAALGDAGLSETEASALRTRLEFDDGRFQYEVDFYNNGTEYEYLIQAKDGDIIARDIEGGENGGRYGQELPREGAGNQPDGGGNPSVQLQENAGEQPVSDGKDRAQPQGISPGEANPADSAINNSGDNYIGMDRAKEIALNHANLNETDVMFKKEKLENDDDSMEYEIEFYFGRTEYEYTIDAVSGNIIEYDVDYD